MTVEEPPLSSGNSEVSAPSTVLDTEEVISSILVSPTARETP